MQECYEACSNLDLKQFTLSPNLNEDDIDEANNAGDANLFLEYDRQQIISAQIACFDKASHRYSAQIMRKHTGFLKCDCNFVVQACKCSISGG